mmetsp:Transcript_12798/g.40588  ORF Transcript_12798/g.40588 Transcript_12798/m.40588 type:complete len:228 (-) Transcript_12798:120-803(-)
MRPVDDASTMHIGFDGGALATYIALSQERSPISEEDRGARLSRDRKGASAAVDRSESELGIGAGRAGSRGGSVIIPNEGRKEGRVRLVAREGGSVQAAGRCLQCGLWLAQPSARHCLSQKKALRQRLQRDIFCAQRPQQAQRRRVPSRSKALKQSASLVERSTRAPWATRRETQAEWFSRAAMKTGVSGTFWMVRGLWRSAPVSRRRRTQWRWPFQAAAQRGVAPVV